jgi:hypothetical protein
MGWSLSGPLTILCTNVLSLETIVSKDRPFVHNIVSGPLKDHPISNLVSVLSIVSKDRPFVRNIVSESLKDHPISKVSILSIVSKDRMACP